MICHRCRKSRPGWWAYRFWAVLGGQAGYYDFCSQACEDDYRKPYYDADGRLIVRSRRLQ